MFYLILQMLFCLIIAFLLGCLVGFFFCKVFCKTNKKTKVIKNNDANQILSDTETDLNDYDDIDDTMFDVPDPDSVDGFEDIDADQPLDDAKFTIDRLEGIGPRTAALFAKKDVRTIGDYLRKLNTPNAREDMAKDLDIKVQPIHDWASMADLMRIDGVDHQYAELLYVSGIQTIRQLADSDATILTNALAQTNLDGKQRISPEDPSLDMVEHWVSRARDKKDVVRV